MDSKKGESLLINWGPCVLSPLVRCVRTLTVIALWFSSCANFVCLYPIPARVRKLVKVDKEVKSISKDGLLLVTKATVSYNISWIVGVYCCLQFTHINIGTVYCLIGGSCVCFRPTA